MADIQSRQPLIACQFAIPDRAGSQQNKQGKTTNYAKFRTSRLAVHVRPISLSVCSTGITYIEYEIGFVPIEQRLCPILKQRKKGPQGNQAAAALQIPSSCSARVLLHYTSQRQLCRVSPARTEGLAKGTRPHIKCTYCNDNALNLPVIHVRDSAKRMLRQSQGRSRRQNVLYFLHGAKDTRGENEGSSENPNFSSNGLN